MTTSRPWLSDDEAGYRVCVLLTRAADLHTSTPLGQLDEAAIVQLHVLAQAVREVYRLELGTNRLLVTSGAIDHAQRVVEQHEVWSRQQTLMPQPRHPEGTPEYEAYKQALETELRKWLALNAVPQYAAYRRVMLECTHGADCPVHPDVQGLHNLDREGTVTLPAVKAALHLTPQLPEGVDEQGPVVTLTPFEAVQVASGAKLTVSTLDGQEVVVRLPTVEEYEEQVATARAGLGEDAPPMPTREQVEELVRPLPI